MSYESRAKEYGLASPDEVKRALADSETYVLDTRTPAEIDASDKVRHDRWVQVNCTPDSCPDLEADPAKLIPSKDATVVLYCRSGRRAAKAKSVLQAKGYSGPILNAGGYDDMVEMKMLP